MRLMGLDNFLTAERRDLGSQKTFSTKMGGRPFNETCKRKLMVDSPKTLSVERIELAAAHWISRGERSLWLITSKL